MSDYGTDGLPTDVVKAIKDRTWKFFQRQLAAAHKREAEKAPLPPRRIIVSSPRLLTGDDLLRIQMGRKH